MSYLAATKRVEAWQHLNRNPDHTVAWPQWILQLAAAERVREMPDGSIHIEAEDGSTLPLPIGYWLVLEESDGAKDLSVMAPDVFAATYTKEE